MVSLQWMEAFTTKCRDSYCCSSILCGGGVGVVGGGLCFKPVTFEGFSNYLRCPCGWMKTRSLIHQRHSSGMCWGVTKQAPSPAASLISNELFIRESAVICWLSELIIQMAALTVERVELQHSAPGLGLNYWQSHNLLATHADTSPSRFSIWVFPSSILWHLADASA